MLPDLFKRPEYIFTEFPHERIELPHDGSSANMILVSQMENHQMEAEITRYCKRFTIEDEDQKKGVREAATLIHAIRKPVENPSRSNRGEMVWQGLEPFLQDIDDARQAWLAVKYRLLQQRSCPPVHVLTDEVVEDFLNQVAQKKTNLPDMISFLNQFTGDSLKGLTISLVVRLWNWMDASELGSFSWSSTLQELAKAKDRAEQIT